jgi:hypothetical protein
MMQAPIYRFQVTAQSIATLTHTQVSTGHHVNQDKMGRWVQILHISKTSRQLHHKQVGARNTSKSYHRNGARQQISDNEVPTAPRHQKATPNIQKHHGYDNEVPTAPKHQKAILNIQTQHGFDN